jgi:hypothetical protein
MLVKIPFHISGILSWLNKQTKKKKKDADKKSKGGREKGREKKKKSLKKVEEFHPQTFCPDAGPPDVARK